MRRDYYVYVLYAPDDIMFERPRYVGKGCGVRAFCSPSGRTKRVKDWIAEMGEEPNFDLIAANLTEAAAFALEIELIAKYGREGIDPGGVLLNISLGGEGVSGSEWPSLECPDGLPAIQAARWHKMSRKYQHILIERLSAYTAI